MSQDMLSALLWILAGLMLVLYLMRRRKRKLTK
jgi:LPXTG-motif cell wall-anchored protein